jgi:hypothetical protein
VPYLFPGHHRDYFFTNLLPLNIDDLAHKIIVPLTTITAIRIDRGRKRLDRSRIINLVLQGHPGLCREANLFWTWDSEDGWKRVDVRGEILELFKSVDKVTRNVMGNPDRTARSIAGDLRRQIAWKPSGEQEAQLATTWFRACHKDARKSGIAGDTTKDAVYVAYVEDGGRLSRVHFFRALAEAGITDGRVREDSGRVRILPGWRQESNRLIAKRILSPIHQENNGQENITTITAPGTSKQMDPGLSKSAGVPSGSAIFRRMQESVGADGSATDGRAAPPHCRLSGG